MMDGYECGLVVVGMKRRSIGGKMDGGFPTTCCSPLLESLIELCREVTSLERLPLVEEKKTLAMLRRMKVLSCLFQDIQHTILPPSSILCLTELLCVLKRTKLVITACKEGSSVWNLTQTHHISNQFHALVKDMGRALDILPLSLLHITTDMREQVELLHKQAKRVDELGRNQDDQVVVQQRRDDLVQLMMAFSNNKSKGLSSVDAAKLKHVLSSSSIGLTSGADCDGEISKLEAEAQKQAGTGGLIVVSNINNLISLLTFAKSINIFDNNQQLEDTKTDESLQNPSSSSQGRGGGGSLNLPDEFRCPISLDLMTDPVIVSSGHTYDRNSIAQWINSGHHTCPKSGQRLIHMALIPNYALKSLVLQWCHHNNISSSSPSLNHHPPVVVDHISASKSTIDTVKMTAEFLVGKLATGSLQIQRQAAYELRVLAKTGMDTRRMIAEAGAIPFLVILLNSTDSRIQENAVTALLNLSIFHNNKLLIMAAGALDSIIGVLELGKTMESRENAAATIFSLSIIDECKVSIGAHARAIISLVGLLTQGTTSGKRDAATALFNLALYSPNKPRIAVSGAIPLLIQLLTDDKAGITDDALALLAILLGSSQGMEETRKSSVLVPLLIDLLRFGSPKGKENAITLLLGLCKDGGEEVAGRLLINPSTIPSLHSLAAHGSLKARRKADALLRLLNRCCSHSNLTFIKQI